MIPIQISDVDAGRSGRYGVARTSRARARIICPLALFTLGAPQGLDAQGVPLLPRHVEPHSLDSKIYDGPGDVALDGARRPSSDGTLGLRVSAELRAPDFVAQTFELPPTSVPDAIHGMGQPQGEGTDCCAPATLDIGYPEAAPRELLKNLAWKQVDDGGWVKRLELTSAQATGLRVRLRNLGDIEVRVYEPGGTAVFGPYVRRRLDSDQTWWSTVMFGNSIGLELHLPQGAQLHEGDGPEIVEVFYMYADFDRIRQNNVSAASCYQELACFPSWYQSTEGDAIALLIGSTGCTGTLLNRTGDDFAPILATARHCVSTQSVANGIVAIWFFEDNGCPGTTPNLNSLPRNDGALLLKSHQDSDYTLLGFYDRDGSGNYCGWDAGTLPIFSLGVGISHPEGLSKKYSQGTKFDDTTCSAVSANLEHYVGWLIGGVSGGSSGSPLFDAARRVRGTLSCGACSACATPCDCGSLCSSYGKYGKFDAAFATLQWFLYSMANPAYVDGALPGDPGNAGVAERGDSAHPFNSVYEATFCAPSGGSVAIKPGIYNESFVLWRPMTIVRWGTTGTVRIGG